MGRNLRAVFSKTGIGIIIMLAFARQATGFSVLTHQAIIDVAWKDALVPLLKKTLSERY